MVHRLIRDQFVRGDPAKIWSFFADPRNLNALTPSNLSFRIVNAVEPQMYPGQMIEYKIGLLPGVSTRWLTEITHVRERQFFVDEQRAGPYRLWHHEHHFEDARDGTGVKMRDIVTYDVGWGPVGVLLHTLWIRGKLKEIFDYRTHAIEKIFYPASA